MDASFNDFNDFDEIRPPDEVIRERLVEDTEDTRCEFQKQIDEALSLSMQDAINQEKINKEYEDKLLIEHVKETNERREKFDKLLLEIIRLTKFDITVKEVYEIIEPIIYNYCQKYIETWETDEETYNKIFKTLSTLRTDKKSIELLKTIIVKRE
jgi:hypothetical protein